MFASGQPDWDIPSWELISNINIHPMWPHHSHHKEDIFICPLEKNVGNVECPPGIWITVKSLFSAAPILWANFRRQMTMDAFVGGGISLDPREISYGTQLNSGSTIKWLRPRTRARPPLWEARPCCPSAVNVIHTHASGEFVTIWFLDHRQWSYTTSG